MRAVACVLALCILFAGADARFQLRNLFQVPGAVSTAINAVANGASNATKAVTDAVVPVTAVAAADATGNATVPATAVPAPAASPSPQLVAGRAGVYVLTEPPAMPVVNETAPAADPAAANVTGPPQPVAGNNLMVVMTMGAADQKDVYKAQQALRANVAQSAGVSPEKVLFFNQSGNVDKRTGQATMSLTLNVECGGQQACARAGNSLYNSSTQANLTSTLSQQGVMLLPNTTQVYPITGVGTYKGNTTLYEGFKIGAEKPRTAALPGADFNNTLDAGLGGLELPGTINTSVPLISTGMEGFNGTMLPGTVLSGGPNTTVVDQSATYGQMLPGATAAEQQQGTQEKPRNAAAGMVVTPLLALVGAAVLLL